MNGRTLTTLCLLLAGTLAIAGWNASRGANPIPDGGTRVDSRTYTVDGTHSSVMFRVKHLDIAWFYGRFNRVSGTYKLDPANLKDSFVKIEIPSESVDSNSGGRDRHLKSPDFFSIKEFPKITFESKTVEKIGKSQFLITGDFTMRGKTRSVKATVTHTGSGEVNRRFGFRTGYETRFTIKRSDFGMSYGISNKVLGDEVEIVASLEGSLQK